MWHTHLQHPEGAAHLLGGAVHGVNSKLGKALAARSLLLVGVKVVIESGLQAHSVVVALGGTTALQAETVGKVGEVQKQLATVRMQVVL
jgi:hypothetical protein